MENEELLKKIYELSTRSELNDAKLSTQVEEMNRRIATLEKLSESMAENLTDMKHLQTIVDSLSNIVKQNTDDIRTLKKEIFELEQKPIKDKANKWGYITDTIFKTLVGVILGIVLLKVGLTK